MSARDKEEQDDELLALASIYEEDEFKRAESATGGEISICLELPPDFKINVQGDEKQNKKDLIEYAVSFLPPLALKFELPPDYPSCSAPKYTLSCKWLSQTQLSALCSCLDRIWKDNGNCVVLFSWMQFLKEETLSFLLIESPLEIKNIKDKSESALVRKKHNEFGSEDNLKNLEDFPLDLRAIQDVEACDCVLREILDFDQNQKQKVFNSKIFTCSVCFCEKLGIDCMDLKECNHVYCKTCLKEYFEIQIRDGNVQCLNCPEPKCTSIATPAQVKELVCEETFARYDRLLLQSTLDLMTDVVYCPRTVCKSVVMLEPGNTMGVCPGCRYAFCALCEMAYHGISPCRLKAEKLSALRDEYLNADEFEKQRLEKSYGRRVLQKAMEELCSQEWLDKNSKPCPRCGTNIQKVNGCNKMTCTGCKQHFCWLCIRPLSKIDPYSHFNDSSSPCFNELFQGIDFEAEDDVLRDEDDGIV
ncbi:E3 ubiquitin-protein ligase RNF14 [Stegostoma tigrinum]|uniref:E3 ubiquitin-protein ligase RNF14 n=1 Tax=Stegostoma tigrinum TaxID=3053191 RepID=UPI00202AE35B|nr:E3 ubiquitin-protein ligase RNF14 [Stegostoma tigrinum]XP_048399845.1 E3 ubiquitin-protein ligase RNF14 [Stegostoma tigrinum]